MTIELLSDKAPPLVVVSVDLNQHVSVPKKTTPRQVLMAAGLDPETRQLVRVTGRAHTPFTDLDEQIEVHAGEVFVTLSLGPTPVS